MSTANVSRIRPANTLWILNYLSWTFHKADICFFILAEPSAFHITFLLQGKIHPGKADTKKSESHLSSH
jgi:hypothetical protein